MNMWSWWNELENVLNMWEWRNEEDYLWERSWRDNQHRERMASMWMSLEEWSRRAWETDGRVEEKYWRQVLVGDTIADSKAVNWQITWSISGGTPIAPLHWGGVENREAGQAGNTCVQMKTVADMCGGFASMRMQQTRCFTQKRASTCK